MVKIHVDFCRKWKITRMAFFGSVLRDDFRPVVSVEDDLKEPESKRRIK